ncbi:MAG: glycosyltransferase family 4 protein [bacterium]|nr:glycosyltransferase family 4 protein [bacterium]
MRIAFVAQPIDPVLPPRQNSIGLIIRHTALRLVDRHQVTVFVNGRLNARTDLPDDGIDYRFVSDWPDTPVLNLLGKYPNYVPQDRIVRSGLYYGGFARAVARQLRGGRFDWVHVLNFSNFLPTFRQAEPRAKYALEMQCEWLTQFPALDVRRRLRGVDLVTGSSGYIADLIRRAHPQVEGHCVPLYNGFEPERFTAAAGSGRGDRLPTTVIFVGRLSPEKGLHTLLEAMELVCRQRPDARLELVGPQATLPLEYIVGISADPRVRQLSAYYDGTVCSDYQAYLRQRASEGALAGRVTFVGSVPQAELPRLYAAADVLANPSFSESFGMSLVEGMATGMPAVATRIGGMPEIVVPGVTGFLREAGDVEGLAADLLECLSSAARRNELGAAGRERALEVFTWEARARRLERLFEGQRD